MFRKEALARSEATGKQKKRTRAACEREAGSGVVETSPRCTKIYSLLSLLSKSVEERVSRYAAYTHP